MICSQCPRNCATERGDTVKGFCAAPSEFLVSRIAPHFWEEPCISGTNGSGTVFFSGCNLGCVYCQNHEISRAQKGKIYSEKELRVEINALLASGVHNLNLVTPSHYAEQIAGLLKSLSSPVPVVWNSSGYDSLPALRALDGLVDIYLPDLKYLSPALSQKYSNAGDYPEVAVAAIKEMYRQVGPVKFDDSGILQRGVVIRHLILPDNLDNTFDVIDWVSENFHGAEVLFSLMAQYTPIGKLPFPELYRTLSQDEYDRVASYLSLSDIESGFLQELSASGEEFIPEFY